jgi:hypothetical protein
MSACLSFTESLNIIGTEPNASPGEFHLLQLPTPSHRVNGLHLQTERAVQELFGEGVKARKPRAVEPALDWEPIHSRLRALAAALWD